MPSNYYMYIVQIAYLLLHVINSLRKTSTLLLILLPLPLLPLLLLPLLLLLLLLFRLLLLLLLLLLLRLPYYCGNCCCLEGYMHYLKILSQL